MPRILALALALWLAGCSGEGPHECGSDVEVRKAAPGEPVADAQPRDAVDLDGTKLEAPVDDVFRDGGRRVVTVDEREADDLHGRFTQAFGTPMSPYALSDGTTVLVSFGDWCE